MFGNLRYITSFYITKATRRATNLVADGETFLGTPRKKKISGYYMDYDGKERILYEDER